MAPDGVKPGHRIYLVLADPLKKKEAVYQRFENLIFTTTKTLVLFLLKFVVIFFKQYSAMHPFKQITD